MGAIHKEDDTFVTEYYTRRKAIARPHGDFIESRQNMYNQKQIKKKAFTPPMDYDEFAYLRFT